MRNVIDKEYLNRVLSDKLEELDKTDSFQNVYILIKNKICLDGYTHVYQPTLNVKGFVKILDKHQEDFVFVSIVFRGSEASEGESEETRITTLKLDPENRKVTDTSNEAPYFYYKGNQEIEMLAYTLQTIMQYEEKIVVSSNS